MRTPLLITLIFLGQFYCIAQDTLRNREKFKHSARFTDVQCLLLINYSQGLSSGVNIYPKYLIKRRQNDFLIEAITTSKNKYSWTVPFTKSEIDKKVSIDTIKNEFKPRLMKTISERYLSEKITYKVGDTSYLIYKHINYNCYDPYCGSKHNHISSVSGETYFSPEFGILVSVDNRNLEFNLMAKIKGKKIPYDLIIEILKSRKTDKKIIQEYIRKTKKA